MQDVVRGPGAGSAAFLPLLCSCLGSELLPTWFRTMWHRQSWAVGLWLELPSVTGEGQRGERHRCSSRGCMSGCKELKNLIGKQCTVSVSCPEYKCLFFTQLQDNGCSEVFMPLQCWDHEAVVIVIS